MRFASSDRSICSTDPKKKPSIVNSTSSLKARQEALRDREGGFTLIELLVVVIIIGILAAIAIPIYLNVQAGAKDSAVKSDLRRIKTAVIAYYASTNDSAVPDLTTTKLGTYGFGLTNNAYASGTAPSYKAPASSQTPTAFCIQAISVTTNVFNVTSGGGVSAGACA